MASRKSFVMDVVSELQTNARKVLAGNGVPVAVIRDLLERPDIMSKLAMFLSTTKRANVGANGLKKSKVLRIAGYKTFKELQTKSPEDIATFMQGLPEADQLSFDTKENCFVILMLPAHDRTVYDSDLDAYVLEKKVVTGQSVMLRYDTAVKAPYKIAGGRYLVVMFGDSAIRSKEEKVAFVKSGRNERLVAREEKPAKIKNTLASKKRTAKRKLSALSNANRALARQRAQLEGRLAAQQALRAQYGEDVAYAMGKAQMQAGHYNINRDSFIASLSPADRRIFDKASKLYRAGSTKAALSIARTSSVPAQMAQIITGKRTGGLAAKNAQEARIEKELKRLNRENAAMLSVLRGSAKEGIEPLVGAKAGGLRRKIEANKMKMSRLRGQLATYGSIASFGQVNYAQALADVNARIEANLAAGQTVRQALKNAIQQARVPQQVKQQITSQALQQVAQQVPVQLAAQQAIQQIARQAAQQDIRKQYGDDLATQQNAMIDGSFDLMDLINSL